MATHQHAPPIHTKARQAPCAARACASFSSPDASRALFSKSSVIVEMSCKVKRSPGADVARVRAGAQPRCRYSKAVPVLAQMWRGEPTWRPRSTSSTRSLHARALSAIVLSAPSISAKTASHEATSSPGSLPRMRASTSVPTLMSEAKSGSSSATATTVSLRRRRPARQRHGAPALQQPTKRFRGTPFSTSSLSAPRPAQAERRAVSASAQRRAHPSNEARAQSSRPSSPRPAPTKPSQRRAVSRTPPLRLA